MREERDYDDGCMVTALKTFLVILLIIIAGCSPDWSVKDDDPRPPLIDESEFTDFEPAYELESEEWNPLEA